MVAFIKMAAYFTWASPYIALDKIIIVTKENFSIIVAEITIKIAWTFNTIAVDS